MKRETRAQHIDRRLRELRERGERQELSDRIAAAERKVIEAAEAAYDAAGPGEEAKRLADLFGKVRDLRAAREAQHGA